MPADPRRIDFDDLYVGRGTFDLALHPELPALDGREVVLTGYLASTHHGHGTGVEDGVEDEADGEAGATVPPMLLTDAPGLCPDCSAAPAPTVCIPDPVGVPGDLTPGLSVLRVAGTLRVGFAVDPRGNGSFLRIEGARVDAADVDGRPAPARPD